MSFLYIHKNHPPPPAPPLLLTLHIQELQEMVASMEEAAIARGSLTSGGEGTLICCGALY